MINPALNFLSFGSVVRGYYEMMSGTHTFLMRTKLYSEQLPREFEKLPDIKDESHYVIVFDILYGFHNLQYKLWNP